MAIDSATMKSYVGYHSDDRQPIFTLANGQEIVPERIHAVNNCSVEVQEPGSVTVIALDQIATVRFVQQVSIEVEES